MRAGMIVKMQRANEVPHLNASEEMAVCRVDNDPEVLAVADPNVAVCGINRRAVRAVEFTRSAIVAIPLIDEVAVLIEVNDACEADLIGGIIRSDVIGTLVTVAF